MTYTGLISGGSALVDGSGQFLVTGSPAEYFFLKDHYINGDYIQAGETIDDSTRLPTSWVPNANVDPLNASAVQAFYDVGPEQSGSIRTQWTQFPVRRPVTYWYEDTPNNWVLAGLGSDQDDFPPVVAYIGRIE